MLWIPGAGAQNKGRRFYRLAVGGPRNSTLRGKLFQGGVGDDVFALAESQMAEVGGIVWHSSGGHNNGPHHFGHHIAVLFDVCCEETWGTFDLL